MNNVIFARTRHHYKTYDDVYDLAALSGFPVRYLDELDWRDSTQTVIAPVKHPEWDSIPGNKRSRLIWWTFERGLDDAPLMDMSNPFVPSYVDEVWASDRAYATHIGAQYVFLGGHRAFGSVDVKHKEYDIVTLMYFSGRRQFLQGELKTFALADCDGGLWGEERHKRLMQTRLMLCAHQDNKPWCEPIRFMLAGCYALPIVSEWCADSGYWQDGGHYAAGPLDQLTGLARLLLSNTPLMARLAASAWRLVCVERPFRQEVEAAL